MATDGVKIIDGDTAHDTYWGIMDLYDSGADFKTIDNELPLIQSEYIDDFDNEIYVTACALALWEIGQMTTEKLTYVKTVIDKGACVQVWTEEFDLKTGIQRQKELDKLWNKISQPCKKVRQRKKFRKITNLHFQPDDLLAFKLKDGNYRAVICVSIDQNRGRCNYILVPTTYNSIKKPRIEELIHTEILGYEIYSGYNQQTTMEMQPGIERIWNLSGQNCNFFLGVDRLVVAHKDFIDFKDKFECVGTLKIIDGFKEKGTFGYEDNFERFEDRLSNLDKYIKDFKFNKYPITTLCDI